MLSIVQNSSNSMIVPESTPNDLLLKRKNFRYEDSNFEIANRAFYATIHKFRNQSYSFLQTWHLHNMYSKSQQTLLGVHPVKPTVLLSGDDFMFTPPFQPQALQQDDYYYYDDEYEEYEEYDDDQSNTVFYYNQQDDLQIYQYNSIKPSEDNFYYNQDITDSYSSPTTNSTLFETNNNPSLSIIIPSQQESYSPEELELSPCSFEDDEQFDTSSCNSSTCSYPSNSLKDEEQCLISPKHSRSLSFSSQRSNASTDTNSYQSLADLMNLTTDEPVAFEYGSISSSNTGGQIEEESTVNSNYANSDYVIVIVDADRKQYQSSTVFSFVYVYLLYFWQFLIDLFKLPSSLNERQPLL